MRPAPKVLILDLSNNYGGSSSRVLSLIGRAQPGSIGLAGLQGGAISAKAVRAGVPVYTLAAHKASPLILPRLIRLIRTQGYNVVDSQNIQSKFWANLAALATGSALVSTINSWYANEHGNLSLRGRLYTALELASNQSLDLYITVSENDRRSLIGAGVPNDSVELIYNAVDVDESRIDADRGWLVREFELRADSFICAAIGRLVPVKAFDILIAAIRSIAQRLPNVVCLIVGEGPSRPALEKQILQAGLQEHVKLVGYRDHGIVLSILKTCDLFIMPSKYEGTPVALLEAAALGRPILASSTGGIPELVTDKVQAVLVRPGDVESLEHGLEQLVTDRQYATQLGREAQERVRRNFSLETQYRSTWNAYRKALSRHNGEAE